MSKKKANYNITKEKIHGIKNYDFILKETMLSF